MLLSLILILPTSRSDALDRPLCSFFLLARAALAYLQTALSVALKPLFPFQQAQYAQVFLLKSAQALCWSRQDQQICHFFTLFFLSDSLCLRHPVLSFCLSLSGRSGRNCLFSPPVRSGYNGFPDTRFSLGTTRLINLPDGERYSCPLQSLVVSLFISLIYCLFSDWRRTVSSKFFDTQVPSISIEELVLPRHVCCVFSRLRCNGHSLLLSSYLSRIGRMENPSYSACGHLSQDTSHLILPVQLRTLCAARSLTTLCLDNLWCKPWRVARLLGPHGLPPCPHTSEGVR